jgi:hypothetical protein
VQSQAIILQRDDVDAATYTIARPLRESGKAAIGIFGYSLSRVRFMPIETNMLCPIYEERWKGN